jgi:TonB-dependent receptor
MGDGSAAGASVRGAGIGAVAGMDGGFRVEGLSPGVYSLYASYVSYEGVRVDGVSVSVGGESVVDMRMSEADLRLEGVTVMAQKMLGSERAVVAAVRNTLPVANGISAQQIGKGQDGDAAASLRRVPGVTLIDGRFIVVRGLARRYNGVWLNGAVTPSGETGSRAFSFDVIPSSLIDFMMVYKSPSAELPADFSGGFVKVSTRNIPTGNTFEFTYQTGYNANATLRNFSLAGGRTADYTGFGAGSRKLPSRMPHLNDVTVESAAALTAANNRGWDVGSFVAIPDQKLSLTLNRSLEALGARIGNVTNVNYSTGYEYAETSNNNFLSYDMKNDRSSYRFRYNDREYRNTVKLGALLDWSLIAGDNKVELHNFFSQQGSASLHQREGADYYSDEDIRRWESVYTARTSYAGQLSGSHSVNYAGGGPGDGPGSRIMWTAGYAYAAYDEPDRKDVKSVLHTTSAGEGFYVSDPVRYYQGLSDHSASVAINFEHDLKPSDSFSATLSAGLYGEYKERDFTARRFVYNLLGTGYDRYADWDYSHVFAAANIDAARIYMKESTNKRDSYDSSNAMESAYLAAALKAGSLSLNAGLRLEYYRLRLDGYEADGVKPVTIEQGAADYFPSLNMAWSFNDRHLLRLAAGRSVNRPEFREVAPYVYYDFGLNANISGSPTLRNAYIGSLDLRYEFYPSPSESIMVGVFGKDFDSPVEQTYNEAGSGLQYTFHNAGRAEALGVEADVRKDLGPVGLKGLSLVFNGAWIYSRVHFDGSFERDRPMQGQSPYLINVGLFYLDDDKGISASLLYNRIGRRIESVGVPMQNPNDDIPDIYEMPRNSLDLTASAPVGRHMEIKGGIRDVFNSRVEYKQFLTLTDAAGASRVVEQLVRSYRPGMTVSVGMTLKF